MAVSDPASPAPDILLVEDDLALADLIRGYLLRQGLRVRHVATGPQAVETVLGEPPDLVLLDVMLPGMDGLEVCRTIRPRFAGVILMLTARSDDIDQVMGLELGADDYLAKPVNPRVLLAHIRALLRRAEEPRRSDRLVFGELVIDAARREVTRAGRAIELSTAEFDLLWLLARQAGQTVSREAIMGSLRGIQYDGLDRSIDIRISHIRKRIEDDPAAPRHIKTVRGVGYLFAQDHGR